MIGHTLAPRLAALRLVKVSGTAETAIYNGRSRWAGLLDPNDYRTSQ